MVVGAGLSAASAAAVAGNLRSVVRPPSAADLADSPVGEPVAVCLPARDEEDRLAPALAALLSGTGVADLRVLVLDDASRDDTAALARRVAGDDPRVAVLHGEDEPPPGWLGKPWACHRLAREALAGDPRPSVLVFLDADVVVAPHGVAATVRALRDSGLDLLCPYPRQLAEGVLPRLVQPLLQWSWLATVPLALAHRSARTSLAVANGQLLAVDSDAYERAGGHTAVAGEVVEDVALLRAVLRSGGRGGVADGTDVATCRMYEDGRDLAAGYEKSLHAAVRPATAAAGVAAVLAVAFLVPPAAALLARDGSTRAAGALGWAAATAGRVLAARATAGRPRDAWAHPASVAALLTLGVRSWRAARAGRTTWRGRALPGRGRALPEGSALPPTPRP